MGGMSGGGSGAPAMTYRVPWRVIQPTDPPPSQGLLLYWFPTSQQELEKSSLNFSRDLSVYASQCVTLGILDARTEGRQFGFFGEPRVNVLLLNIALDSAFGAPKPLPPAPAKP